MKPTLPRHPLLAALLLACAASPLAAQEIPQDALAAYRAQELPRAAERLRGALAGDPANPDLLAWLGETERRLGNTEAALQHARAALRARPCHSLAHQVLGVIFHPSSGAEGTDTDSASLHLARAVECDPSDGNAWIARHRACDPSDGNAWIAGFPDAMYRGDTTAERRIYARLVSTGFLTPAQRRFGRWLLEAAPPRAILLTHGDLDYLPAVAVQQEEGVRPDVVVVLQPYLDLPFYARRLRDRHGLPVPAALAARGPDDFLLNEAGESIGAQETVRGWFDGVASGQLGRPLVFALTADTAFTHPAVVLRSQGAVIAALPAASADAGTDLQATRRSLEQVDPAALAGPGVSDRDRSPIRWGSPHPSYHVALVAAGYVDAAESAGQREEARWGLARMAELDRVAPFPAELRSWFDEMRETLAR